MGQNTSFSTCGAYAEDLLAIGYTAITAPNSDLDTPITLICIRCGKPVEQHHKETPDRNLALPQTQRMYQVWINPFKQRRTG